MCTGNFRRQVRRSRSDASGTRAPQLRRTSHHRRLQDHARRRPGASRCRMERRSDRRGRVYHCHVRLLQSRRRCLRCALTGLSHDRKSHSVRATGSRCESGLIIRCRKRIDSTGLGEYGAMASGETRSAGSSRSNQHEAVRKKKEPEFPSPRHTLLVGCLEHLHRARGTRRGDHHHRGD